MRALIKDALLNMVAAARADGDAWIAMLCALVAGEFAWRLSDDDFAINEAPSGVGSVGTGGAGGNDDFGTAAGGGGLADEGSSSGDEGSAQGGSPGAGAGAGTPHAQAPGLVAERVVHSRARSFWAVGGNSVQVRCLRLTRSLGLDLGSNHTT